MSENEDDTGSGFSMYNHTLKPDDKTRQGQFHEKTLDAIMTLQEQEQALMKTLSKNAEGTTLTNKQKSDKINKINELANARLALYTQLNQNASYLNDRYGDTKNSAMNQRAVVKVVEVELNNIKKQINTYKEDLSNKLRLIEINDFYTKKYDHQTQILKTISVLCVIIIIITFCANRGYLSETFSKVLVGLVMGIGFIMVMYKLWDVFIRDNHIFDEFDWFFNALDYTKSGPSENGDTGSGSGNVCSSTSEEDTTDAFTNMSISPFSFEPSFNFVPFNKEF